MISAWEGISGRLDADQSGNKSASAKRRLKMSQRPPVFEKRKSPRSLAALPLEYGPINSNKSRPGHTVDISEGGVMVALPEQIGVGEKLRLKISFSIGPELHSISTTGKAVWWIPKREETGHHRYGLEFEDISSEDLEKLRSFLTNFGDG